MDGWMDGWMDGDGWMYWCDGWNGMDWMDGWIGWMHGWMDGWMDEGWIDRYTVCTELILDFLGAYSKSYTLWNCVNRGGGGTGRVVMNKHICPCFVNCARESARETVSLPRLAMRSTRCFSLDQETLRHSRYMNHLDWFLRRKGDSTALQ